MSEQAPQLERMLAGHAETSMWQTWVLIQKNKTEERGKELGREQSHLKATKQRRFLKQTYAREMQVHMRTVLRSNWFFFFLRTHKRHPEWCPLLSLI